MNKLFRQVRCSDRLPEEDKCVIVIFENGSSMKAHRSDNGYWFICNPRDLPSDCDDPEYWLEPVEIPGNKDVDIESVKFAKKCDPKNETFEKQADIIFGYKEGYKAAINHLTGGK